MTIKPVIMPKWGLGMEEGKVLDWYKAVGDFVKAGEDLVDIETSKIANTFESPHEGILRRVLAEPDQVLPCGTLLAVIAGEEIAESEIDSFIASHQVDQVEQEEALSAPGPQVLTVEGRKLRYLQSGGEGDAMLFIHGFGANLDIWQFVQPVLAQSRRCISVDLPGHGESDKNLDGLSSLHDLADLLAAFLSALQVEKVDLVGNSMGGAIALALAAHHPHLVARLVLLDPVIPGSRVNRSFIDGFVTASNRRELEPLAQMLFHDRSLVQRQMIDDLLRFKRLDGAQDALAYFGERLCFGAFDAELKALPPVTRAVVIAQGESDEIVTGGLVDLPWDVVWLPAVGHVPQIEAPAKVIELILGGRDA